MGVNVLLSWLQFTSLLLGLEIHYRKQIYDFSPAKSKTHSAHVIASL